VLDPEKKSSPENKEKSHKGWERQGTGHDRYTGKKTNLGKMATVFSKCHYDNVNDINLAGEATEAIN